LATIFLLAVLKVSRRFAKIFSIMLTNRKPIRPYPYQVPMAKKKYLPSFFVDFEYYGEIKKAEIRPLESDKGYYTVILNGVFLAHIHKMATWTDAIGKTNEMFQVVGALIEDHLNRK
jgi:hypothetical protein